mgnify:CR=1 FL=1
MFVTRRAPQQQGLGWQTSLRGAIPPTLSRSASRAVSRSVSRSVSRAASMRRLNAEEDEDDPAGVGALHMECVKGLPKGFGLRVGTGRVNPGVGYRRYSAIAGAMLIWGSRRAVTGGALLSSLPSGLQLSVAYPEPR